MFAVMGITGNVGGAIARTLLQHGKKVRGIVRDESKAQAWKDQGVELVTADYDDKLIAATPDFRIAFFESPRSRRHFSRPGLRAPSFSLPSAAKKTPPWD